MLGWSLSSMYICGIPPLAFTHSLLKKGTCPFIFKITNACDFLLIFQINLFYVFPNYLKHVITSYQITDLLVTFSSLLQTHYTISILIITDASNFVLVSSNKVTRFSLPNNNYTTPIFNQSVVWSPRWHNRLHVLTENIFLVLTYVHCHHITERGSL